MEQSLALRIKAEEPQYVATLRGRRLPFTADELLVAHATINQGHSPPYFDVDPGSQRQARTEDQRVEQIALSPDVTRHGAVVKWTGQR